MLNKKHSHFYLKRLHISRENTTFVPAIRYKDTPDL